MTFSGCEISNLQGRGADFLSKLSKIDCSLIYSCLKQDIQCTSDGLFRFTITYKVKISAKVKCTTNHYSFILSHWPWSQYIQIQTSFTVRQIKDEVSLWILGPIFKGLQYTLNNKKQFHHGSHIKCHWNRPDKQND